jgi:zinc protease
MKIRMLAFRLLTCCILLTFCTTTNSASIPKRPEQLKFNPLNYTPPDPLQHKFTLKSGPTVYLVQDNTIPIVQITVFVKAGEYLEPTNLTGLAELTSTLLVEGGTSKHSADEIDEMVDFLGAILTSSCSSLYSTVSLNILSQHLTNALELLREILATPAFQEDRLKIVKQRVIQEMAQRNDDSSSIESREAMFLAYGTNSWVSRIPTRRTIEVITQDDLIKFHQHWYWPSNFIVAVSGDFQSNQILPMLEAMFNSWPFKGEQPPLPPIDFKFATPAIYMVHKQVNQARVRIIMPNSIKWGDPEHFAAIIMNHIFGGGGLTSRLFNRVRSDEGLAYSVHSYLALVDPLFPRPFEISLQTKSRTTARALALVFEEIEEIRKRSVSNEELQRAKEYLIGRLSDAFSTPHAIASTFAQDELCGRFQLNPNYWKDYISNIQRVTASDVLNVAKRVLDTNHALILIVGDKPEILRGHPDYNVHITNFVSGRIVDLPLRDPFTLLPIPETK